MGMSDVLTVPRVVFLGYKMDFWVQQDQRSVSSSIDYGLQDMRANDTSLDFMLGDCRPSQFFNG